MIARDVNGSIIYDKNGIPKKAPNPNYIWKKLDEKIADLKQKGDDAEAERLESLKTVHVDGHDYRVDKALIMHPLIGRETRPFEYHPVDEYGCTVCHGGNGRSLVTSRAHGPVYEGQYEETYMGPKPEFLEEDIENNPEFAKAYGGKPGHELLFQTTPLLVGNLIQAKCVLCHKPTSRKLSGLASNVKKVAETKSEQIDVIRKGFEQEYNALVALLSLRKFLNEQGIQQTFETLQKQSENYTLPPEELKKIRGNINYLRESIVQAEQDPYREQKVLKKIDADLLKLLGSKKVVEAVQKAFDENEDMTLGQMWELLKKERVEGKLGSLHIKGDILEKQKSLKTSVESMTYSVSRAAGSKELVSGLESDIDRLTKDVQRGEGLFFSQACYACHRITGLSRGGVGPELTDEGLREPWFVKESIVWPQADLKTSTMPNYRMDHEEIEDLVTFLLAQRPENQSRQGMEGKSRLKAWEEGNKNEWEEAISPSEIRDVQKSMEIFATEGCAACHRLKGFDANVGFAIEKESPTFDELYEEKQWFQKLFPEHELGSNIVQTIESHMEEIDKRIVDDVQKDAILDEIEKKYPKLIESYYADFKFASRAKNHEYETLIENASSLDEKRALKEELSAWKERVHRILLMFVQEYGLGRQIGPRLNWSGIYRSDKWLMEHFWNPSSLAARSIMPVFPFDNTKFLALTYMLGSLGQKNRGELREIWNKRGFNPEMAFDMLCAQCHGNHLKGNGPVSEWIYPVPKNLSNPVFMRNLTKERAIESITHGIHGTPMPPWGEAAKDKDFVNVAPVLGKEDIAQLVNWIYRNLPGERFIREEEKEVQKWEYRPEDVIKDLKKAGDVLESKPQSSLGLPTGGEYIASLTPVIAAAPQQNLAVEDVFDVMLNPYGGLEKNNYYIKKKYYTKVNLAEGKAFFELNCAICHGKEADGAGLRAGVMEEAKPRMLINLPWIESRDDLRLIRSIYYGVPGTSMIAWGDQTTSKQRLQLVMYIRSLTESKRDYEQFKNVLFQVFQSPVWAIEDARSSVSKKIGELEKQSYETRESRQKMEDLVKSGEVKPEKIAAVYSKELKSLRELEKYREIDKILSDLINQVKKEQDLYQSLGDSIFKLYGESEVFTDFLHAVSANQNHFSYKDEKLRERHADGKKLAEFKDDILKIIGENIQELDYWESVEKGKISTSGKREKLSEIKKSLQQQKQLEKETLSTFSQLDRLREKQKKTYEDYIKKLKILDQSDDRSSESKIS